MRSLLCLSAVSAVLFASWPAAAEATPMPEP